MHKNTQKREKNINVKKHPRHYRS